VLFHVTANAEWSNLPLSGLFVQMLRRIVALSAGIQGVEGEAPLAPIETLDGFGRLGPAPPAAAAIPAAQIEATVPSPRNPPGWYGTPGQDPSSIAYRGRSTLAAPSPRSAPRRRRPRAPHCSASAACRPSATSAPGCWPPPCCCSPPTC
jgi:hypothetical protein